MNSELKDLIRRYKEATSQRSKIVESFEVYSDSEVTQKIIEYQALGAEIEQIAQKIFNNRNLDYLLRSENI